MINTTVTTIGTPKIITDITTVTTIDTITTTNNIITNTTLLGLLGSQ